MIRQIITFQIGEQLLGVDILAIREIRAWSQTTLLPQVPDYVRGVVNLRGTVLPVIDLSARLGWGLIQPSARHVIIVVQIGHQLHGLIVDAVNDIVALPEDRLQPAPNVNEDSAVGFLEGLAPVDGKMVMVLSLNQFATEIDLLQPA